MLRLDEPPKPEWLDPLPGIRIKFRPPEPRDWRAAKRAARIALASSIGVVDDDPVEVLGDAFSRELIRRCIVEWEGIGDLNGEPVGPTQDMPKFDGNGDPVEDGEGNPVMVPGTITMFLADPDRFEACDRVFITPVIERSREGNGYAGSPNGTSAEETPATDIASSAAKPAPVRAAKSARTSSTRRERTKASLSGK